MAAIACELRLDLCHFDVQQAFVQAELKQGCDIGVELEIRSIR